MLDDEQSPTQRGIPKGARLVQLRDRRKAPATSTGHLAAVLAEDFVPLGQNIGIVLDEAFLAVDIDEPGHPQAQEWLAKLPATWQQTTPKGRHLLFRTPVGWRGTNLHKDQVGFGDVKTLGYIVAPGSAVDDAGPGHPAGQYRLVDAREPAPAPSWLLGLLERSEAAQSAPAGGPPVEREAIRDGERDNELASIAGFLRSKGFSESAMASMLTGIVQSGAVEQPAGREVTDKDIARIARSIAKKAPGQPGLTGAFLPEEWITGAEVPAVPPAIDWILPGFVPDKGLTILYGDGKIGKSSWAKWLAARVTKTGKGVVFIGSGEETFEDFVQGARLCGANHDLLFKLPNPERFWLPQSVGLLEQALEYLGNTALVYIDAIYSHFAQSEGQNTAERARSRLRALAEMSIAQNVAVLGTIHENAAGGMLGSREMRNVARSVIHAKRKKDGEFTIWGKGANGFQVDYGVRFPGTPVPVVDPETGAQRTFVDLFGDTHAQSTWVLSLGEKVGGDEENEIASTIALDTIEPGSKK